VRPAGDSKAIVERRRRSGSLLENLDDDRACKELYGVCLATLREKLRKGQYLDDIIVRLRVGDRVHVYNPQEDNGACLGQEGDITEAESAVGKYWMDCYDEDFDTWEEAALSRDEIELLEGANPHYIQEMKQAPWWPDIAEERARVLAEQGRTEADHTKGQDPE
jgi:hypothetical protein